MRIWLEDLGIEVAKTWRSSLQTEFGCFGRQGNKEKILTICNFMETTATKRELEHWNTRELEQYEETTTKRTLEH